MGEESQQGTGKGGLQGTNQMADVPMGRLEPEEKRILPEGVRRTGVVPGKEGEKKGLDERSDSWDQREKANLPQGYGRAPGGG